MALELNSSNDSTSDVIVEHIPAYSDLISDKRIRIILITVHVVISLVAITGNGLVLFIIYKKRSLRKSPDGAVHIEPGIMWPRILSPIPTPATCRTVPAVQSYFISNPFHMQQCQVSSFLQGLFAAVGFLTIGRYQPGEIVTHRLPR